MRFPTLVCTLLMLSLSGPAALCAASKATLVLTDPSRDDYGDGTLKYPLSPEIGEGDLDLLELSAEAAEEGTWFTVTMRRNVRPPAGRVIDAFGRTQEQVAKLGFYAFNVDIYVDSDRVEGSGHTETLPGRKLTIDPKTAWEKVISLSPQPEQASIQVRQQLNRASRQELREQKPRVEDSDLQAARQETKQAMESDFFFPRTVQVLGRRIRFLVPASFLGGAAKAEWAYAVVVTGASLESRFDTTTLLGKAGVENNFLLIPVGAGLSAEHFAGREEDGLQSPAVDILVPAEQKQEEVLRDYDLRTGRLAQIRGVVPKS